MEVTSQSLTSSTKFALFGSNYGGSSCVTYSAGLKTSLHSPPKLQLQFLDLNANANAWSRRKQLKIGASTNNKEDTTCTYDDGDVWLLQPVGDGDSRHIGFKVPMPDAYEISSSIVTVGRVAEKADLVIPVATVSGEHARLEMKEGSLVVTDLNSTNGTFIDDKRLSPGVPATIQSGRYLTFGDTNLAIFRVSKLKQRQKVQQTKVNPLLVEELHLKTCKCGKTISTTKVV
ncbi:FHA domain-containing protein [Heracleum sosnowskyi]|uniref:FHA domain-containing protein n=1 Tax=Heracleum sosnowskyi TaxID=360622 RepID=A0AAD8MMZ9_9APIA|nr:FHA domain-containing protein [Heracleum sosnowskyi]